MVSVQAQCIENPPGSGNYISADGGECINTIITSVPFLRITPDARSGAMGDVGLALSADGNSMHYNVSKLIMAPKDLSVSVTYTPWLRALGLNDVYLAYLAGYKKIDNVSAAGGSLRYFSLGSINFTDENGNPIGSSRPREFEFAGGYSRKLSDNLAVGVALKFIYSNLASGQSVGGEEISSGRSGGVDLSLTYQRPMSISDMDAELTLATAITNIGPKITYTNSANKDLIPTNLGIGSALKLNIDEFNDITFALDINKLMVPSPPLDSTRYQDTNPQNQVYDWKEKSLISGMFGSFGDATGGFSEELRELMYSVGVEYWYDKQFAVRAGYYSEHKTKGNRKFLTVGLGLRYNIFGLDFSYLVPASSQRNPLDNTLRFTLTFDFGALEGSDL